MKRNSITQHVLRFALLLLISGCISTPPTQEFLSPVPTHTILPTLTVTPTITPTLTIMPTLVEATPVNTMTTEERKNFLIQFLSNSGDCRLPCWWNITPGQSWEDAEKVIHELGGNLVAVFPGYDPQTTVYGTYIIDGIPTNDISVEEKDGLVYAWHINSTNPQDPETVRRIWKNYSTQKIVSAYGMPNRILLWVVPSPDSLRYGGYSQWLFYDELGFSIRYDGRIPRYFSGAPFFRICSETDPLLSIELDMQSPDNNLPLDRFDKILEDVRLGTDTGKLRVIHSLQEATGLDDTEIYNTFIQNQGACFAIPSDIWSVKQ
jgi:hypothetical protein